jgi:hypothetical protein
MEQSLSWEANKSLGSSRNFPPFMEPKDSLPCSQKPAIDLYPKPDEFNP